MTAIPTVRFEIGTQVAHDGSIVRRTEPHGFTVQDEDIVYARGPTFERGAPFDLKDAISYEALPQGKHFFILLCDTTNDRPKLQLVAPTTLLQLLTLARPQKNPFTNAPLNRENVLIASPGNRSVTAMNYPVEEPLMMIDASINTYRVGEALGAFVKSVAYGGGVCMAWDWLSGERDHGTFRVATCTVMGALLCLALNPAMSGTRSVGRGAMVGAILIAQWDAWSVFMSCLIIASLTYRAITQNLYDVDMGKARAYAIANIRKQFPELR